MVRVCDVGGWEGVAVFLSGLVAKSVGFVRAGYPREAPPTGHVPVLALLPRRLSDEEVCAVAAELGASGGALIDGVDIGAAITRITDQLPAAEDVERVKRRLQACG